MERSLIWSARSRSTIPMKGMPRVWARSKPRAVSEMRLQPLHARDSVFPLLVRESSGKPISVECLRHSCDRIWGSEEQIILVLEIRSPLQNRVGIPFGEKSLAWDMTATTWLQRPSCVGEPLIASTRS